MREHAADEAGRDAGPIRDRIGDETGTIISDTGMPVEVRTEIERLGIELIVV